MEARRAHNPKAASSSLAPAIREVQPPFFIMAAHFENDWGELLAPEFQKDYYLKLREFLIGEYRTHTVYPDKHDIFNALHATAYKDVKAVILGQDPYHGPGQAHGLCFSVKPGVQAPPSLLNIFKELSSDLGLEIPNHGCLQPWAAAGVLLLNTVLTVRAGVPNSHKNAGWISFTDRIISILNNREKPIVFILWGRNAAAKRELITNPIHAVLTAPHPSPLSASSGFFGSRPFSKTNEILTRRGEQPIDWRLPPVSEIRL